MKSKADLPLPGREEIRIALDYLSREAGKLAMPLVANLIGAAADAVDLYDADEIAGEEWLHDGPGSVDSATILLNLDKSEMGSC